MTGFASFWPVSKADCRCSSQGSMGDLCAEIVRFGDEHLGKQMFCPL